MKFFSSMSSVGRRLFAPGAAARPPAFVASRGRQPAREIATREPVGSEWSISKPGQAPPPPTGTAARPSGALHTCGARCAGACLAHRLDTLP